MLSLGANGKNQNKTDPWISETADFGSADMGGAAYSYFTMYVDNCT